MARQTKTQQEANSTGGLGGLILKQLTASLICFFILFGMSNSSNASIKNCADAFGRALRHNPGLEDAARDAVTRVSDILNIKKAPHNSDGEITFQ